MRGGRGGSLRGTIDGRRTDRHPTHPLSPSPIPPPCVRACVPLFVLQDRTYVPQHNKTRVYDMGLQLFRDSVARHPQVSVPAFCPPLPSPHCTDGWCGWVPCEGGMDG